MKSASQLEQAVLDLPPAERAHLVLTAWESLESDPAFPSDPQFDPEGLQLALERDREIESGSSKPLTHQDFLRLTGSGKK